MNKIINISIFLVTLLLAFILGAMYGCKKGAVAVTIGTYECKEISNEWYCESKLK